MYPFLPNAEWYQKHWYEPKPAKSAWRMPAALVTSVALLMLVWLG